MVIDPTAVTGRALRKKTTSPPTLGEGSGSPKETTSEEKNFLKFFMRGKKEGWHGTDVHESRTCISQERIFGSRRGKSLLRKRGNRAYASKKRGQLQLGVFLNTNVYHLEISGKNCNLLRKGGEGVGTDHWSCWRDVHNKEKGPARKGGEEGKVDQAGKSPELSR